MIKYFNQLGDEIENRWRAANYDENAFPQIAAEELEKARVFEKTTAWEVIEWTLRENFLPEQRDLQGSFGDPPITLYNSPRFYIDVYFWLEGTTAIHQHAFCGAFQVLEGSSIHSHYEFREREKINVYTEIGDINLLSVKLLEKGDVQKIEAGKQYIHGLFHLDLPSATIVVRTLKSPLFLPQYSYHKPFLAIDPFFSEPNTTKKLQAVSMMLRAKRPETERLISDLLETSDFQTTYMILSNVRHHLKNNGLNQLFNTGDGERRFEDFMEIARRKHGEKAEVLPAVFRHQDNISQIVQRRSYVQDNNLRFFLALLMNVEGKEEIFRLVRQRFPENEPLEKILDWVFELAQTRVFGVNVPNALGIENFDEFDLIILEYLLKDFSEEEIIGELQKENEDAEIPRENVRARIDKIKNAVIFEPLFA